MARILVAYYSLFGSTRQLAEEIARQTNGALRELVPQDNYSFDYNTAVKKARGETERGFCPRLIAGDEPIDEFDIVFVGTPNWFSTMAPPVMTFLRQHDFTGKTVLPFCANGGGGAGHIEKDMSGVCANASFLPGIAVAGEVRPEQVKEWLQAVKLRNPPE